MDWIVKNYSNLDKAGIKENYNQATFNLKSVKIWMNISSVSLHVAPSLFRRLESYKPR